MTENNKSSDKDLKSVFISYSWDDEDHKQWVLNLADKLTRDGGVYVHMDRYDLKAGKAMAHFMEKAVSQTDKVLMIMTPAYKDKADNRIGGVGYEYSMITQELYERLDNEKFIPVRRKGSYGESAPKFLKGFISHDMTNDFTFEKDFNELLRIIYEEPEIIRPPLGKRPTFTSRSISNNGLSLIDEKTDLSRCGMPSFAKWKFNIGIDSLKDFDKTSLYKLINSNIIVDRSTNLPLPNVLNINHRISHHPEILYEIPLHNYFASNHLITEKLLIEDVLIHYEFAEYGNQEFWLLFIKKPFSTLLQFFIILERIHKKLNREIDINVNIRFESNRRALLYANHSPFSYPYVYNLQKMGIPGSKAEVSHILNEISKDKLFVFFEKLYSIFVAENLASIHPFISLDRDNFDIAIDQLFD